MSIFNFENWSERRQVLAIIVLAGLIIGALCFFLLLPLNRRRAGLEREIERMRSQLAQKNYLLGEEVLMERRAEEETANRQLLGEWSDLVSRLSALGADGSAETYVGHIDYKVALFEVRQRLRRKSDQLNVGLPHDLGMEETVGKDLDARKLMLQLRTVEKLAEMILDLKIDTLRNIDPLPPVAHRDGGDNTVFLEEYPVRVDFFGNINNLYDILRASLQADHVFVLRRLAVRAPSPNTPGLLEVSAVLSAVVVLKNIEDFRAPAQTGRVVRRPMGY